MRVGIGQKDADLTILDSASGSGILALDADGVGAFLEKTGFIDDQDAVWIGEMLDHIDDQSPSRFQIL